MNPHQALAPPLPSSPPTLAAPPQMQPHSTMPPSPPAHQLAQHPMPSPNLASAPAPAPVRPEEVAGQAPHRQSGLPPPLLRFPPGYSPDSVASPVQPPPRPRPLTWQDKLERRVSHICSWVPFVFVCLIMLWSIYAFAFHVGPLMDGIEPTPSFPFKPPSQSPVVPAPSPDANAGPAPPTGTFKSERIPATVVVSIVWILTTWSYFKVVFTNPGSPKSALSLRTPIGPSTSSTSGDNSHNSNPSDATIIPIHDGDDDHVPLDTLNGRVNGTRTTSANRGQGGGDAEENVPLVPILASGDPALPSIATKRNGAMRYCRKCDLPKPDRAHHCRICNQCVLKMDHHCPWVAGCVGFGNYKFFLLFLFYLSLYCFTIFGFTVSYFFLALATGPSDQFVTASHILGLTLCSLLFGLTLFGFFCYHLSLVLANQTTIEAMETQRYDHSRMLAPKPPSATAAGPPTAPRRAAAAAHANPFDLGWRRNFMQVFGPARRWWMWFVPVASHQGNGITYPVALFALEHPDEEHVHQLA
ncbi:DHHC palmitoyltransferase-domain-containing protein [Catenaria anguillulae PL171]|uniref:Palmitoyltransferase n=1 Tax=Catenaria anguillulae PL171 TaxID=765915 RepID=A0A1Y2I1Q8_9FUNG|nr:DHHC palmitoyltransferase-domain-containing protein [Catenaria anguillulae PL171]